MIRILFPAACALAASACVSVLPEQAVPSALYRLQPIEPVASLAADIVVREPTTIRLIGGAGMVVEDEDGGLRLIEGAEWAGRPTRLLQEGLIDALSSPDGASALAERTGAPGRFELSWQVEDLMLTPGGVAVCVLDLTLLDARTRATVSQSKVRETMDFTGRDFSSRGVALSRVATACVESAAEAVAGAVNAAYSPAEISGT